MPLGHAYDKDGDRPDAVPQPEAEVRRRTQAYDETLAGERFAVPLGEMKANVVEVYSIGLVPDRKGLGTVIFAEAWTGLFGKPGDGHARSWMDNGSFAFVQGTPFSGGLHVPNGSGPSTAAFRASQRFDRCGKGRPIQSARLEHRWVPSPCPRRGMSRTEGHPRCKAMQPR